MLLGMNAHDSIGAWQRVHRMQLSSHGLAATENAGYFEACVSDFNPLRDMFGKTYTICADGCVEPLDKPGIGVEVDEALFAKYPLIDGPGYVVKF